MGRSLCPIAGKTIPRPSLQRKSARSLPPAAVPKWRTLFHPLLFRRSRRVPLWFCLLQMEAPHVSARIVFPLSLRVSECASGCRDSGGRALGRWHTPSMLGRLDRSWGSVVCVHWQTVARNRTGSCGLRTLSRRSGRCPVLLRIGHGTRREWFHSDVELASEYAVSSVVPMLVGDRFVNSAV
jgi:hypothetical protein